MLKSISFIFTQVTSETGNYVHIVECRINVYQSSHGGRFQRNPRNAIAIHENGCVCTAIYCWFYNRESLMPKLILFSAVWVFTIWLVRSKKEQENHRRIWNKYVKKNVPCFICQDCLCCQTASFWAPSDPQKCHFAHSWKVHRKKKKKNLFATTCL